MHATSSSPSAPPAGPVVTYVTVVVPEIVTVYVPPSPTPHAHHEHARRQVVSESGPSCAPPFCINKYGNCDFIIPRTASTTSFNCTFTKFGLDEGSIYTMSITYSTNIQPETGLTLWTYMTIDEFSVQTQTLSGAALGATFTAVTGSFTPTTDSLAVATLTGYPVPAEEGTLAPCPSSSLKSGYGEH